MTWNSLEIKKQERDMNSPADSPCPHQIACTANEEEEPCHSPDCDRTAEYSCHGCGQLACHDHMEDLQTTIHVVYHDRCADGFGAAWATHSAIGDEHQNRCVQYHPRSYGQDPPDAEPGDTVHIFDFSFPLETMLQLNQTCPGQVFLVDHHESAREALEGRVPNCRFDTEHSGAVLAWQFWFGPAPVPRLLQYVQDRDLWRWELQHSREISAGLDLEDYSFDVWDSLSNIRPGQPGDTPSSGTRTSSPTGSPIWPRGPPSAGYQVPTANAPVLQSEVCEKLLARHPGASFAAAWREQPGTGDTVQRKWSLRSRPTPEGFDVSTLAGKLGGGGHPHAAGFTEKVISDPRNG